MNRQEKLVVSHLDGMQFALFLSSIERVIHSVEIHPLEIAPDHIHGIINLHGEFLPVVSIRTLFNLPEREIELSDHFIIANSSKIKMALWVDAVDEVVTLDEDQIEETKNILLESNFVKGLFRLRNGMVLIHDLDKFLTAEQISRLTAEIEKHKSNEK